MCNNFSQFQADITPHILRTGFSLRAIRDNIRASPHLCPEFKVAIEAELDRTGAMLMRFHKALSAVGHAHEFLDMLDGLAKETDRRKN